MNIYRILHKSLGTQDCFIRPRFPFLLEIILAIVTYTGGYLILLLELISPVSLTVLILIAFASVKAEATGGQFASFTFGLREMGNNQNLPPLSDDPSPCASHADADVALGFDLFGI